MWPGETVVVIATGQSLTQEQVAKVEGMPTIVVNDAWKMAPWADVLYAADKAWWIHHPEAMAFKGIKVCAQPNRPKGVEFIRPTGMYGFDPDPSCVRTGGNSGYQAVHVAIHTGASRILLLGFDMHGTHFFGPHQEPLRNTHPSSYPKWISRFKQLAIHADIVNCTPGSALTTVRCMSLDEALEYA